MNVGVDRFPIHIPAFVFGGPTSKPIVQPGSSKLVYEAGSHHRLQILVLPSGPRTAAIDHLETSAVDSHWGEVMLPVEREVFRCSPGNPGSAITW